MSGVHLSRDGLVMVITGKFDLGEKLWSLHQCSTSSAYAWSVCGWVVVETLDDTSCIVDPIHDMRREYQSTTYRPVTAHTYAEAPPDECIQYCDELTAQGLKRCHF